MADEARQGRLFNLFSDHGIAPDRLKFGTGGNHVEFLEQYSAVDIILDTWPYSGGLTTCESLMMGVPVITLTGDRFCGRHATAHVRAAGFPDWAASDEAAFVEAAVTLSSDLEALAALRRGIRKTTLTSPLCDVTGFSQAFYAVLREEWQSVCQAQAS